MFVVVVDSEVRFDHSLEPDMSLGRSYTLILLDQVVIGLVPQK